jgi:hypothetical protein
MEVASFPCRADSAVKSARVPSPLTQVFGTDNVLPCPPERGTVAADEGFAIREHTDA